VLARRLLAIRRTRLARLRRLRPGVGLIATTGEEPEMRTETEIFGPVLTVPAYGDP
jgi:hypothetical protein